MPEREHFPLLEAIASPADLRALPRSYLPQVADELRGYLLRTVSHTGGHLAAGLGTVELTVALHYTLETPRDRLVWDIGHQGYPHKILTGRREAMGTLRRLGGLSGFLKRAESPYDAFGAGHSSTSVSAALGMAVAAERSGEDRRTAAVIGDGALTAGMAFEALNHAGDLNADLLVIVNDNTMSISPNVGALSQHLARLLSSPAYSALREGGKRVLQHLPPVHELARRGEAQMTGLTGTGGLFEELGFRYFGPMDGHDVPGLVDTLLNLRDLPGPRILHLVTRKGKGFGPAEASPVTYHGVSRFDYRTGELKKSPSSGPSYTQVFSRWLCDAADQDPRVIGITPAMSEGSGLTEFADRFPSRYYDVGIAEQHAMTFAAGLAADGLRPVLAIYSTFLQRAYDQLIHDVALQNLPVLLAIDRAGLVGPDGPTHAGSFDLSYLRCVPNMVVMAPADEDECRRMLTTGLRHEGPAAVRYPRGTGPGVAISPELEPLPLGRGEIRRCGTGTALLAFGSLVTAAETAGERLGATVANMRFVKPLDEDLVVALAREHGLLVTLEENAVAGGAGAAVAECLAARGITVPLMHLGLPDRFVEHGTREELLAQCGLDTEGIVQSVTARQPRSTPVGTDST